MKTENLPDWYEYGQCQKCGHVRGPEVKPLMPYCDGRPQRPMKVDDVSEGCEFGGPDEHLHWQCVRCGYTTAMRCYDAPKAVIPTQ